MVANTASMDDGVNTSADQACLRIMQPQSYKLRVGKGYSHRVQQLEQVLQQKQRQLAKLKRIQTALKERQQVVSSCIRQQVDLLAVLGRLTFSLPEPDDAAYEAKATAAVEALIKDMEAARLMQEADSLPSPPPTPAAGGRTRQQCRQQQQARQQQQQARQQPGQQQPGQQQQQQQQQQGVQEERFNMMIARTFLADPQHTATLRRIGGASVQELAGMLHAHVLQLGLAVARYPRQAYMPPAELAAMEDTADRRRMQLANARLHAAHNALSTTAFLLHIVGDKVLQLSTLNLETLQVESPPEGFWEEVAHTLAVPPGHMSQLHSSFLLYSGKRSELTHQMQDTMCQLQQLLAQLTPQQQQDAAAAMQSSSGSGSGSAAGIAGCDGLEAAAVMFEAIEGADSLLQQLSRQVWSLREASRCFIFHFADVVDPLQMSLATINSWPFLLQPPPVVEVLVKQAVARQQQQEQAQAARPLPPPQQQQAVRGSTGTAETDSR